HKHAPSKKVKALIDLVKVGLERMAALAAGGPLEAPFKAALAEDRERFLRTHGERTGSPLLQRNTGS
ncbi:MAG: hypothetical protein JSS03_07540, partial [Proteobacteria bacterium]|nr:hypothetical protein [Pseudomonadota bacterium]